ncbi:hypothetical protein ACJZ2D_005963 [Fusarium nematophilum]
MEEPVSKRKGLHCPICQKSFTNDNNRKDCQQSHLTPTDNTQDEPVNTSHTVAENTCRAQCLEGKLAMNVCGPRGKICTYPGRLSRNADFCSPPVAGSGLPQDLPSKSNGLLDADDPILSLDKFGPDVAPVIDTVSGDSQLPTSTPTWDNEVVETGFPDMLDLMTPLSGDYQLVMEVEAANSSGEAQGASDYITTSGRAQEPQASIPASLLYHDPSSMLERRKFSKPELELTGDLALYTLRSYLYAIADRDSIPPFIHPKYRDLMELGTSRPSPLYAAIKLAKMLFLGRGMNKTLIWSLIRMEQERLLNDHPKFDKWEILEALQSLILYVLMRITEGRHDYTNFDTQLLVSVYAVCRYIATNFGMAVGSDELDGGMILWKDWVFFESRRRCATVFLIIDGILHARISDPSPAMPEFTFAPAPSPGTLWGAESEVDWAVSYAGHLRANATHGMLRNGDLVALKESVGDQHDRCDSQLPLVKATHGQYPEFSVRDEPARKHGKTPQHAPCWEWNVRKLAFGYIEVFFEGKQKLEDGPYDEETFGPEDAEMTRAKQKARAIMTAK